MLPYANEQIATRLGNLTFQARRTANVRDAESIHDLRVAIRRFTQSIVVFSSLLPKQEVKRIRKRLRRMMDAAGEVRDRDIALEFLDEAGVAPNDPLRARIVSERAVAEHSLIEKSQRWSTSNLSGKWRAALRLNVP
jgi:CHAD domain-containing protein